MVDLLPVLAVVSVTISIVLFILLLHTMGKLGFLKKLKARKKEISVTLLWSGLIALLPIKSYWLVYVNNPVLMKASVAWTHVDQWIPKLGLWDFAVIFLISLIVGMVLMDLEVILYSIIAVNILSFIFAVAYSSYFIWYILRAGEAYSIWGGWWTWGQYVVYIAIKNIFRMTFPFVALFSFIGAFFGAFGRAMLEPSAET